MHKDGEDRLILYGLLDGLRVILELICQLHQSLHCWLPAGAPPQMHWYVGGGEGERGRRGRGREGEKGMTGEGNHGIESV